MLPELNTLAPRRKAIDWTQTALAKRAGVSQSLVTKLECGTVDPTYSKVKALFDTIELLESQASSRRQATAGEIANSPVVCVGSEDSIGQANDLMGRDSYSQLPVLDEGRAVGSISHEDITEGLFRERDWASLPKEKVRVLMKEPFPQVAEGTPGEVLVDLLRYASAVLVVKGGDVTGIVARADLPKLMGG